MNDKEMLDKEKVTPQLSSFLPIQYQNEPEPEVSGMQQKADDGSDDDGGLFGDSDHDDNDLLMRDQNQNNNNNNWG